MSMDKHIMVLKKLKREYLAQDEESRISSKAFAQRLLNRAGLSKEQRMTVFFNSGGVYEPDAIEKVLRHMHRGIAEQDTRLGKAYGTRFQPKTDGVQQPVDSKPFRRPFKKVVIKKRYGSHVAGHADDDDDDVEYVEQDDDTNDIYTAEP